MEATIKAEDLSVWFPGIFLLQKMMDCVLSESIQTPYILAEIIGTFSHRKSSDKKNNTLKKKTPKIKVLIFEVFRAGDGTRTRNLLITNQLLYQLSYTSTKSSLLQISCSTS